MLWKIEGWDRPSRERHPLGIASPVPSKMSTLVMDFSRLRIGNTYKVVSNAGYFSQVCVFTGYAGEFACFVDGSRRTHHVHHSDCYRSDNPVYVYE